ncbi:MAG: penicillin-binding protein [Ilumatobacteraceae bacterium]|nr:penicillin-binding protein [Ilumatobacteraceae bacterium]
MRPTIDIDAAALAAVDAVFADFQGRNESPGMAYGIVVDGQIVHAGGVGSAVARSDDDGASTVGPALGAGSVLRIASMTKSFTAAAALLLRDEGALRLDEPIGTYVPELESLRLPTPDAPVPTIRMFLTMSGGLPTDDPWADREESMSPDDLSALLEGGLSFSGVPGTGFQYSNLGFVIVGRAIANVTGERFHDVVRSRLIEPLGMTSTGFSLGEVPADHVVAGHHQPDDVWHVEPFAEPGEFSPLGGIFSSVRDLATWVGGFTAAFVPFDGDDGHPLSRATRREMQQLQRFSDVTVPTPRTSPATPTVSARVTGYGLGLMVVHDTRWGHIVGHSGGYPGYGSHMRWHPATGVGVIALGNGRYVPASQPASAALEVVLAALHAPAARQTRWARTRELQRTVQQLVLRWDDAVADAIFSRNVDLDLGRAARRDEVAEAVAQLGVVDADQEDPSPDSPSAAEIDWWITGEHGRLRIELGLTPHAAPLVQALDVEFVGTPSAALAAAATAVATGLSDGVDGEAVPTIECIAWKHPDSATFRVRMGVDEWKAELTVDPATDEVSASTITRTPPSVQRFAVWDDPIG